MVTYNRTLTGISDLSVCAQEVADSAAHHGVILNRTRCEDIAIAVEPVLGRVRSIGFSSGESTLAYEDVLSTFARK
jgi:hypothetical protein